MADINRVVIVGRLVRDLNPSDQRDFAYTPGTGVARANISVAVTTRRRNGDQWVDESNFFNVTIWGKTAESLKPYLTKGKQIAVEGYLKQDRWVDKETGKTRDRITIVADNIQLLGGVSGGRIDGGNQSSMGVNSYQPNPQMQQGFDMPNGVQQGFNQNPMQQTYQQMQSNPSMDSGFSGDMSSGFPDEVPF